MDALTYLKNRRDFILRLGMRNIVYTEDDILYLVFYDIDTDRPESLNMKALDVIFKTYHISYMLFTTKHGYHVVGLTPVNALTWAHCFTKLKQTFMEKYAGNTIRLDHKEGETKNLVYKNTDYYVIPNLYNLILNRLDNTKDIERIQCEPPFKYRLQIENYRSFKN